MYSFLYHKVKCWETENKMVNAEKAEMPNPGKQEEEEAPSAQILTENKKP